jgi:hypothetical protein
MAKKIVLYIFFPLFGDMWNKKVLVIANFSLFLIGILLILNLFSVPLPTLGMAFNYLDHEEPLCISEYNSVFQENTDLDNCCLEARKKLKCVPTKNDDLKEHVNWHCFTGQTDLSYWFNNKAYHYCTQLNIWR